MIAVYLLNLYSGGIRLNMVINEIHFKLKDGRDAVIRSPREEDVQGMIDYLYISAQETEFILSYPEECTKYTYERELEFVNRKNESPNEAMLVCIVDGAVAGNSEITFNSKIKIKHRASVGIALLKAYWNQGIGSRLFKEMIRLAEEREDLMQIELDFVEGNDRARHLYEKMGFRITGVIPDAIRLKDGTLLNEYHMIRRIAR